MSVGWLKRIGSPLNFLKLDQTTPQTVENGFPKFWYWIELDTTYTPTGAETAWQIFWDEDNQTITWMLKNGVGYQFGNELYTDVQNDTWETITNGTPVMFAEGIGNSWNLRIQKAIADNSIPVWYILWLATQDIADWDRWLVTWRGKVRWIDTTGTPYWETWNEWDLIFVSATTAWYLTNVPPEAPNAAIFIWAVINVHATVGTIDVWTSFPSKLTELSDVNWTALTTNGQTLYWDQDRGVFDFTTDIVVDQTTGRVGIGTATPSYKFEVQSDDTTVWFFQWATNAYMYIKAGTATSDQWIFLSNSNGLNWLFWHDKSENRFRFYSYNTSLDMFEISSITGNTSVLQWDFLVPNGNVGIWTTSPDTKLHTYGTNNTIRFSYNDTNYGEIYSKANWGITLNPMASGNTAYVDILQTHTLYGFLMHRGAVWCGQGLSVDGNFGLSTSDTTKDTIFYGGNFQVSTEIMRLKGTGNVGIWTTSPWGKLHAISDTFPVWFFERETTVTGWDLSTISWLASWMLLKTTTSWDMTDWFGWWFIFGAADDTATWDNNYLARIYARRDWWDAIWALQFWIGSTGSTLGMTLRSSGNVGIWTSSPQSILNINWWAGGLGSLATWLTFGDGDTGIYEALDDRLAIDPVNRLLIRTNGIDYWTFAGNTLYPSWGIGARITAIEPSSTVPTIIPRNIDTNSGLGSTADDAISLIAGGVEGIRITETAGVIQNNLAGSVYIGDTITTPSENLEVAGNLFLNTDSNKIYLWAWKDVWIYYDWTDAIIDTWLVAPSDLIIDCGIEKTLELEEWVYMDENFDPIIGRWANAPDLINLNSTSIKIAAFNGAATLEEVSSHKELNHNYQEWTDLSFHIHRAPTTTGTGNVKWFLEYYITDGNWPTVKATGTITVTSAASGTAWDTTIGSFWTITWTSFTIWDQVSLRLYRDPTDAEDTYWADAVVKTFGYHYKVDTMGSRQLTSK